MPATFDPKTGSASVTCDHCGKPITHSNDLGMFCEDNCGIEECREAKQKGEQLVGDLLKMFGEMK
jgi:hypothetical protein